MIFSSVGKAHRATWIGAAILIGSEVGRLTIGQTHW